MSQLRTIARSIARTEKRPPWDVHNQPAHMMRARAVNVAPVFPVPLDPDGSPSEWAVKANRESRNAAKGLRRDRREHPKAGPAEQPRRQRRARYYRFASRLTPKQKRLPRVENRSLSDAELAKETRS